MILNYPTMELNLLKIVKKKYFIPIPIDKPNKLSSITKSNFQFTKNMKIIIQKFFLNFSITYLNVYY